MFGDYHSIYDSPSTTAPVTCIIRKCKWFDKDCGEIFSYNWDLSEYYNTQLNTEFVYFLKKKIDTTPANITKLTACNGMYGTTLHKQNKKVISDYR